MTRPGEHRCREMSRHVGLALRLPEPRVRALATLAAYLRGHAVPPPGFARDFCVATLLTGWRGGRLPCR